MERVSINLYPGRMASNIRRIMDRLPAGTKRCLVLKADAYGLGAGLLGPAMDPVVDFFAVATAEEALFLRNEGVEKPILILGFTEAENWLELAAKGIRVSVYSLEDARKMSHIMTAAGREMMVHLKLDTGMNRIGFKGDTAIREMEEVSGLPGLRTEGLFSHFFMADAPDLSETHRQFERFMNVRNSLEKRGICPPICHIANSAAAMVLPETALNMVRLGIAAYGLHPSEEMSCGIRLEPVAEMKSCVIMVKDLQPGETVGYGATFRAERPMRLATIPVGYADGYSRRLSGQSRVLIRGRSAPICGNICMDQLMADVTDIPDVQMGDPVTLIGRDGEEEITLEELAQKSGILNYEFQCGLSRWRNHRHLIEEA